VIEHTIVYEKQVVNSRLLLIVLESYNNMFERDQEYIKYLSELPFSVGPGILGRQILIIIEIHEEMIDEMIEVNCCFEHSHHRVPTNFQSIEIIEELIS